MRWLKKKPIRVSVPTFGLMLLAATPLFAQQCPGGVCQMPAGYLTAPPVSGTYRTVPAARPRVLMSPHRRAALTTTWATFEPTSTGGWAFTPERRPAETFEIVGAAAPEEGFRIYLSDPVWQPLPQAPRTISYDFNYGLDGVRNFSSSYSLGGMQAVPVGQRRAYAVPAGRRRIFFRGFCGPGGCQY